MQLIFLAPHIASICNSWYDNLWKSGNRFIIAALRLFTSSTISMPNLSHTVCTLPLFQYPSGQATIAFPSTPAHIPTSNKLIGLRFWVKIDDNNIGLVLFIQLPLHLLAVRREINILPPRAILISSICVI
ncbi:uncharacterized protein BDW70DRAFT_141098 [Aspergillus foveolatus]|uniref:uncharacterized protein n=1 Tax=Aspergillus foveolatus TaxID=210207 RepID=UPI003CCE46FC